MTNVTKVSTITNTTGALIRAGHAAVMVDRGQEYAWQVISRTLIAAEAGALGSQVQGVGTLRDLTNPPVAGVNGFLFAQFKGVYIKSTSLKLIRPQNVGAGGALRGFSEVLSSADGPVQLQWYTHYNQGVSSLYVFDMATAVNTNSTSSNVLAGDTIVATVALGNS